VLENYSVFNTNLRRKILIPFYWKYINQSNVLNYLDKLKDYQWKSWEENQRLQRKRLFLLIKYAGKNIPYYQNIFQSSNFTFSEPTILEDVKRLPVLTKETIRTHFDELYCFQDKTYYRNTSGGSTGEPVIFYQDKEYLNWANAAKRLFNEWAGRRLGDPMIKLWGSLSDILEVDLGFKGFLRRQISGITILNSYRMTEKDVEKYVRIINAKKPDFILTYTNGISEIANFIREYQLSIHSPSSIMTAAGVLYPEVKKTIEEVFQTKVFNRYGSREVSDIACNCEKDNGLHLIPSIHYLEVVDHKGNPVRPGVTGNLIVTLLTNYTMPLIRYQIGDRGILSDKMCSCGRGFPLLKKVKGRMRSVFRNKEGDYIDGGAFIRFFYFRNNIKQFQVIQKSLELITVNIVLKDKSRKEIIEKDILEISDSINKIMKSKVVIQFNLVDEVQPSSSGKHGYVISKVKFFLQGKEAR